MDKAPAGYYVYQPHPADRKDGLLWSVSGGNLYLSTNTALSREDAVAIRDKLNAEKARAEAAEAELRIKSASLVEARAKVETLITQLAETQAVVREVAESLCADDYGWERDPKVAKLRAVLPEAMESR